MSIIQIPTNEYHFLNNDDLCYHFYYYTSGGYTASNENSLVLNFKKPVGCKNKNQWYYKKKAIKTFANMIYNAITQKNIYITIIPCATSNPRNSSNFDDRLDSAASELQKLNQNFYDVQLCLDTKSSYTPAHNGGARDPKFIKSMTNFILPTKEPYDTIFLIDDVFTTGAHFRAYKDIIQKNYPNHQIIGVFLARFRS